MEKIAKLASMGSRMGPRRPVYGGAWGSGQSQVALDTERSEGAGEAGENREDSKASEPQLFFCSFDSHLFSLTLSLSALNA